MGSMDPSTHFYIPSSCFPVLREDFLNDMAMHVREAAVDAVYTEGELFVVEAELVEELAGSSISGPCLQ